MSKSLRIPPYGMVHLGIAASRIIQMPAFLRLQHLKQLGFAYLVYPTATHTRCEHCIGTSHLAHRLGERLHSKGLVSEQEVETLEVAALLHDVGHGPFSHAFEEASPGFHHEAESTRTADMVLTSLGWDAERIAQVQCMITGKVPARAAKPYLYEVVSNALSGLDVDKMDYLLRDHLHCFGTLPTMDPLRIMDNMEVVGGHLVVQSKEAENVMSLFALRAKMHSIVYQHRVVVAADMMFARGFREADLRYDLMSGRRLDDRFIANMRDVATLRDLEDRHIWPSRLHTEEEEGWTTVGRKIHYGKGDKNPLDSITFVHRGVEVEEPCADLFLPRSFSETLRIQVRVPKDG